MGWNIRGPFLPDNRLFVRTINPEKNKLIKRISNKLTIL